VWWLEVLVGVLCIMPLSDFFGWPAAHNGIGDGKVLFGAGERPDKAQFIQDALAGTSASRSDST
jgi:hypothetical protein